MASTQDIEQLLEQIFVFDYQLKQAIHTKLQQGLDGQRLQELYRILQEAFAVQQKALAEKLASDPDFYSGILEKKREAHRAILAAYEQKISAEDKRKMNIIIAKIQSL